MPEPYRIAVVTGGRADYGLLRPLWLKLKADVAFEPTMIATGAHLMKEQGHTLEVLKNEGTDPLLTVDMRIEGDRPAQLGSACGRALDGFSSLFEAHYFDLLVILGDRFEMLSVAMAAMLNRLPIAHIHGGEATFGLIDDAVRHSLTKMAALHFVSHADYANRVIQMGEQPDRVFNVGAIGLDNIADMALLSRQTLSEQTDLDWSKPTILLTYHPVTLNDQASAYGEMKTILQAVQHSGMQTLITMPNMDAGGGKVYQAILDMQQETPEQFRLIKSLGQQRYLSAMYHCAVVLGNSSSGIIESASFKKPVVDIGTRQQGRVTGKNVLRVACDCLAIEQAIETARSDAFNRTLSGLRNPYGEGKTAEKMIQQLKSLPLNDQAWLLKKGFYDWPKERGER
ncbi:UDP-N-acetylglucosamine 2-epimerase [Hydrogenovibrio halophilus]|uniref:UDP-N-acetylglucosamine 2-epimerase n=1 Tax=Hydrogenovibrio halophilus TaxID=373391 RepID=UPI00036F989F|nr:UDP-N-acetylglucosamine 2-epimerase [Hydrogenovibrio halophilus]